MNEPIRDAVLEAIEASLEAQLLAIRRLRKKEQSPPEKPKRRKSQMDMVQDILVEAGEPLHLLEIVRRVNRKFGITADPDSLGSALTKRVVKKERFARPGKNTFALLLGDEHAG
jgi:hypothetical protein